MVKNDVYTPNIDGQELIDKLNILVCHELRWSGITHVWDRYPHELVYEAIICKEAWANSLDMMPRACRISLIIEAFGFDLIPYANYRRDNPPAGDWSNCPFSSSFKNDIATHYRMACEQIIEASNAELLRD